VTGADVAQVASTVFAAASAFAAMGAVRLASSQSATAREALEADTQPLITDVPRGVFLEEIDWREGSGKTTRRRGDRAEIGVGTAGPEPVAFASVPVRNVGNGCARIGAVTFLLGDDSEATGRVDNPVLPSGELTHVRLAAGPRMMASGSPSQSRWSIRISPSCWTTRMRAAEREARCGSISLTASIPTLRSDAGRVASMSFVEQPSLPVPGHRDSTEPQAASGSGRVRR
jgi:hypothetical protein